MEGLRDATPLLEICSGIYFLCQYGQLVYIGQSVQLASRISTHRAHKEFDRIFFLPWPRFDLNRIETALIKILRPPLNGTFKDSEATEADRELLKRLAACPAGKLAAEAIKMPENKKKATTEIAQVLDVGHMTVARARLVTNVPEGEPTPHGAALDREGER
jgi:hypothetical protein